MTDFKKANGVINSSHLDEYLSYPDGLGKLLHNLDHYRGALLTSSFEYPGRYTCWDIGFYNPPLVLTVKAKQISLEALNTRGETLLIMIKPFIQNHPEIEVLHDSQTEIGMEILTSSERFNEEERSHQPSAFTVLRLLLALFKKEDEPYLGFYGSCGYDLIQQFETLKIQMERSESQRDMVLYFPDEIYVVNHRKETALVRRYEFSLNNLCTDGLAREGRISPYSPELKPQAMGDHAPGVYAQSVIDAKKSFKRGDLFEVVLSQTFYRPYVKKPSELFLTMKAVNPSPYGFFVNLGENEFLIGASPEMYVRVTGKRVETCPISGTVKRGGNAIEDAEQILSLLASDKEKSELTMCTDVDRNDKSRICVPGSVKIIGRRQIEMYSRLIHTVDHVEGELRDNFDSIDAFLSHMWVVTVTGAPKLWAMNFIEAHEKSPRLWYGGAVGWFGVDGNINTGLILRTVRLHQGIAELRVGATLLYDSDPESEEKETQLKASAFLNLLENPKPELAMEAEALTGVGKKVLLIDHEDSFVHTLANYIRQTGAQVLTVRHDRWRDYFNSQKFDLVFLSPGPGTPEDFNLSATIETVLKADTRLFGVCLGLQGIVEYFGGELGTLDYPMHGKPSQISICDNESLFIGLDNPFTAGRYHSLYAIKDKLPPSLKITALSEDGIIMGIKHESLAVSAVQFHPETLMSMPNQAGLKIIQNLMRNLD